MEKSLKKGVKESYLNNVLSEGSLSVLKDIKNKNCCKIIEVNHKNMKQILLKISACTQPSTYP